VPAELVLGPLLRFVGPAAATVWVETDRPCTVEVRARGTDDTVAAAADRTWSVHGHHYALVVVGRLRPATTYRYDVLLDGTAVWPAGDAWPPSLLRTPGGAGGLRLAFGSCRRAGAYDAAGLRRLGPDALVALAEVLRTEPPQRWPDILLLGGDQIYADEPSPETARWLRSRPGRYRTLPVEASDFDEYAEFYAEAWREPAVRWLLSTVPTAMILDDHDLRDGWNNSAEWRRRQSRRPWWRRRVTAALGSYWVYQHVGNLSPEELERDGLYRAVRDAGGDEERTRLLDEQAWRSDAGGHAVRWSYVRDLDDTRLLVVDSRCSRRLRPDDRAMLDGPEWEWVSAQAAADVDHLLVATTLPYLLPHGVHHLEGLSEATGGGAWGHAAARIAVRLRQSLSLEHWAAFRASFDAMAALLRDVALGGGRARGPATVLLLSGDIHCSYVASASLPGVEPTRTRVHQLVQSPFRNPLSPRLRTEIRLIASLPARAAVAALARLAGVRDPGIRWRLDTRLEFDNGLMVLELAGRRASVRAYRAVVRAGRHALEPLVTRELGPPER
jgi:hypothetical protein